MSDRRRQRAAAAAAAAGATGPDTFPPFVLAEWFRPGDPVPEPGTSETSARMDVEEYRWSSRAAAAMGRYSAARAAHRHAAVAAARAPAVPRRKIIAGSEQPEGRG